jgi:SAM-dependent methyltransferase
MALLDEYKCPICANICVLHDKLDLNRACEHQPFPAAGRTISYFRCLDCGFCFAPEMHEWSLKEFEDQIYNEDYIKVDPDYGRSRPLNCATVLVRLFGDHPAGIRHLDFGGGSGLLSRLLQSKGWNSTTYDPFANKDIDPASLGKFDLITAFEVFEHVPDVNALFQSLRSFLAPKGIIFFSTLVSDGMIEDGEPLSWWYAAPRNGHISLFSTRSLEILSKKFKFNFGSHTLNYHLLWTTPPKWAAHVVKSLSSVQKKSTFMERVKGYIADARRRH